MYQLAFIAAVDSSGKELKIPAADVKEVRETPAGCKVVMANGTTYELQDTAADTFTSLNTLWTNYLSALAGTVP